MNGLMPFVVMCGAGLVLLAGLRWFVFREGWPHWTGFTDLTVLKMVELLIVPLMIAVGAFLLQRGERDRQFEIEQRRAVAASTVEAGRLQENTLQTYLDDMTSLILSNELPLCPVELGNLEGNARHAWIIAETRTKTVMRQLNGDRNDDIVRLLAGAGLTCLIGDDISNVSLQGAELGSANLAEFNLSNSEFAFANLSQSNLAGADLRGADLFEADLSGAEINTETRFDTTTILPDSTFWTAETDMGRFTNPNRPDFWRSFDEESPAYLAIATARPTATPGEAEVSAATQAAATETPTEIAAPTLAATDTPNPTDTSVPTLTATPTPNPQSAPDVQLTYTEDWLVIVNISTLDALNLGDLDFVWTQGGRALEFALDVDFTQGDEENHRFQLDQAGCLQLVAFREAIEQPLAGRCGSADERYSWFLPGEDGIFWRTSSNDKPYFEVQYDGQRVAICGLAVGECRFALVPQDPIPGAELLE